MDAHNFHYIGKLYNEHKKHILEHKNVHTKELNKMSIPIKLQKIQICNISISIGHEKKINTAFMFDFLPL